MANFEPLTTLRLVKHLWGPVDQYEMRTSKCGRVALDRDLDPPMAGDRECRRCFPKQRPSESGA